jgi:hypothetical protein
MAFSSMMYILTSIKIYILVQKLIPEDQQVDMKILLA